VRDGHSSPTLLMSSDDTRKRVLPSYKLCIVAKTSGPFQSQLKIHLPEFVGFRGNTSKILEISSDTNRFVDRCL